MTNWKENKRNKKLKKKAIMVKQIEDARLGYNNTDETYVTPGCLMPWLFTLMEHMLSIKCLCKPKRKSLLPALLTIGKSDHKPLLSPAENEMKC